MSNNYVVYIHISPSNKRYIGITSQKPNRRWRNGKGYERNEYFTRAINKYGWDNFEHIILATDLTEEQAENMEIELIAKYDTTNPSKGYNITKGGEGGNGRTWSDEERERMSEQRKGLLVGELNGMYGKHHTEEALKKLSEAFSGENNPMYGRTWWDENTPQEKIEEWKKKVVHYGSDNGNSKAVICITTMEIFDTIKEGAEKYKIKTSSHIGRVCNGKRKSCGKLEDGTPLVWKFLKDYLAEQEQNNNNNID